MIGSAEEVKRLAMSQNEQNYGLALLRLRVPFDMQYGIGMQGVRGSQRIDLVAYTPPKPTAFFIQGGYWHKNSTELEDVLKQKAAEKMGFRVVLVSEAESADIETALAHARRNL